MARVGLLEDNVRIAKLCAMMLCYAGHEVSIYEHPRDCLCALQLSGTLSADHGYSALTSLPIDVLILDLHLPDITGLEIIRLLRSQPLTRSMPLIFCTAATPSEISKAMRLAPTADFLEKPFSYRTLVSAITHALQIQRA
jgi:DNA-binding response OmpR family regulator